MNDWVVGFGMAVAAFILVCIGWMTSASTIGWECRNTGMFYVGEKVYECAVKEKK